MQSENLTENLAVLCRVPLAGPQAEIVHNRSTSGAQTVAVAVDAIWTYLLDAGTPDRTFSHQRAKYCGCKPADVTGLVNSASCGLGPAWLRRFLPFATTALATVFQLATPHIHTV